MAHLIIACEQALHMARKKGRKGEESPFFLSFFLSLQRA